MVLFMALIVYDEDNYIDLEEFSSFSSFFNLNILINRICFYFCN